MIREKRDEELGRQPLLADYGGWDSYREAVSYIIRHIHEGPFLIYFQPISGTDSFRTHRKPQII